MTVTVISWIHAIITERTSAFCALYGLISLNMTQFTIHI